jgi:ribosomal-protein-alanine N-acetyltransferase
MANWKQPTLKLVEISVVHAAVLAEIHNACFEFPWCPADFQELLISPTVFGFISQIKPGMRLPSLGDPNFNGFILCSAVPGECEILTIGVLPLWRRHHIALKLIQYAILAAKKKGARKLFLEVSENNKAAHMLYADQNFQEVGRRLKYYREGKHRVDAIILSKSIRL